MDVRRADESIVAEALVELPDKNQLIYVYSRSGNRSKSIKVALKVLKEAME